MITLRYTAGHKTLTMGGHEYDLRAASKREFGIILNSVRRRFETTKQTKQHRRKSK